jgi:hypothetical protein
MSAVAATAAVIKFVALIMPDLRTLAIKLYERHGGDVAAAKVELRHIGDHGAQLKNFEVEIQRRLDDLKNKRAAAGVTPIVVPADVDEKPGAA